MTELLLFLILGLLALCLVGAVCGLVELTLSWIDKLAKWWRRRAGRDLGGLSEEWCRRAIEERARERQEHEGQP